MEMEVKGTAVIAVRDFVKKNHSQKYLEWVNSLSGESKKIFMETIDSTKWYPVESGAKEPTEKIAQLFFNSDMEKGAWEAGRYSAHKALSGIYKIFVKATTPTYIIQRASRVFSTYYRPSELNVVETPAKGVTVEMSKVPDRYFAVEFRIAGWMQKALEISGCKNVIVDISEARQEGDGKVIKFSMKWD